MLRARATGATVSSIVLAGACQLTLAAKYVAIDLATLNPPTGYNAAQYFNERPIMGDDAVGYGFGAATGGAYHALLWAGLDHAVDLNPAGFSQSWARSVGANQQVGFGNSVTTLGQNHALIWSGTAASAVDLNPPT